MKTSKRGIELIKSFEGLSLKAVKLTGEQYYTIGYGHYGPDVPAGKVITKDEAEMLLRQDLIQFEQYVTNNTNAYAKFKPTQNQFDALVSFTYNCGPKNLKQLIYHRTVKETAAHWMAYTNSGSEMYREGLKRRRRAELQLFLEGEEELDMTKDELMNVEGTGDKPSAYAVAATKWAKEQKIFNGDGRGNYGWQQPVKREDVAVILYNLVTRFFK